MKKIILVAAFIIGSQAVFAQKSFGLKAGLNLSTITNYDGKIKPGFHVGGLAHLHISPTFSVQPEVMFSTQGTKQKNVPGVNLSYINVPVLLQYNFDNGFRLQGGPQIGFRTSAKRKINDVEDDISDLVKSVDISIPLGFSYLSKTGFGVDARYNFGIPTIFEHLSETYRNSVIQVGIFYLLNHKHKSVSK